MACPRRTDPFLNEGELIGTRGSRFRRLGRGNRWSTTRPAAQRLLAISVASAKVIVENISNVTASAQHHPKQCKRNGMCITIAAASADSVSETVGDCWDRMSSKATATECLVGPKSLEIYGSIFELVIEGLVRLW